MPSSSARRNGERSFGGRGQSVLDDVFSLASTVIESGKHAGAQRIFAVAGSTRAFGEDLGELPHLKAYAEAAADGLEDLADYVDRTEVPRILDDIGAIARRQPVLTAAVALAMGIAMTQAIRNRRAYPASGPARRRRRKANGRRKH